ncbi:MAG: terminase B [Blautia sp.]|nr:terminase B [Blautia sp.]
MDDIQFSEFLDESIPLWRNDPVMFFREVLSFEPDEWQAEAARDLAANPKVSIKSGQGVGKTGLEAAVFLWFITCFPYPRIVATAPTKQQLHDVLWSEISKWMSKSELLSMLLKWTKTYVYMVGNEKRWFGVARTATKPENMQGFHEDNMLFIVDEASGVADPIMEAILGTLSGANNKLLLCGNPTRTSGTFYDSHTRDRALYKCHTVSSADSSRTNKENIDSLIRKYGWDSNVVRVRVRGEFPEQEDDVFIRLSWIESSINTELEPETAKALGCFFDDKGRKIIDRNGVDSIDIGCDVARFGDDRTVIGYKINEVAKIFKKYNGQDTTWTAGNICRLYNSLVDLYKFKKKIYVKIDDGGVGGGVTDQLREIKRREPERYKMMEIVPIHFGQPIKHKYYYDTTTYMMGIIREMLEPFDDAGNPRQPTLVLPNDDDLVGQLSCRKYSYVGGKIKVESKKEMKERGLSSPDEADCMLLTCFPVKRKVS